MHLIAKAAPRRRQYISADLFRLNHLVIENIIQEIPLGPMRARQIVYMNRSGEPAPGQGDMTWRCRQTPDSSGKARHGARLMHQYSR